MQETPNMTAQSALDKQTKVTPGSFEHWCELMSQWEFAEHQLTHQALLDKHAEPHRHYHTMVHVKDCLAKLDKVTDSAQCPKTIALALYFHDAIYKPFSRRNEANSAKWAASFMQEAGATPAAINKVQSLIMATCHRHKPEAGDQALMVDIDLSILGAKSKAYAVYEQRIRREYHRVPSFWYGYQRRALLKSLLARDRLFQTDYFASRFEQQARENITAALRHLGG